jgi:hypothetical protein
MIINNAKYRTNLNNESEKSFLFEHSEIFIYKY